MKKAYLVTGVSGTGKSSVCAELTKMGHEAYDIEDEDGMFAMYRKDTGELYTDFENADPEKIKNAEWRCDIAKLKELLSAQKSDIAFYCGVASNMDDIIPLFDKMILIKASADTLHARLSNREGTEDMGNTEESRRAVLGWKDWWEGEMVDAGAVGVDASGTPAQVATNVLTAL